MSKCKKCGYINKGNYKFFVCAKCNYVNEGNIFVKKVANVEKMLKVMGEKY